MQRKSAGLAELYVPSSDEPETGWVSALAGEDDGDTRPADEKRDAACARELKAKGLEDEPRAPCSASAALQYT